MNRRSMLALYALALCAGATATSGTMAQQKSLKEQLVGTWLVAAVDNIRPDGSRFQSLGPNPKGIMMFDANGWFSFQLAQPGRPKFASDNRLQGTAEENKATVQGSLSYYASTRSRKRTASFTSILRAAHGLTSMASITSGSSRRSRMTS
jgi:hypothetical protein